VALILKLLVDLIYGMLWGAVLLVVAALLLPEHAFLAVLRKIKPDLVSKNLFLSRLRLAFDYLFNNKEIILSDPEAGAPKEMQSEIAALMHEKRLLEGNLFFLDLLQNLSKMLVFSVMHSGYDLSAVCSILDQSMEYLQYYAKQLKESATCQNINQRVYLVADLMKSQVNDSYGSYRKRKVRPRSISFEAV